VVSMEHDFAEQDGKREFFNKIGYTYYSLARDTRSWSNTRIIQRMIFTDVPPLHCNASLLFCFLEE
jgi:hypothetical protein